MQPGDPRRGFVLSLVNGSDMVLGGPVGSSGKTNRGVCDAELRQLYSLGLTGALEKRVDGHGKCVTCKQPVGDVEEANTEACLRLFQLRCLDDPNPVNSDAVGTCYCCGNCRASCRLLGEDKRHKCLELPWVESPGAGDVVAVGDLEFDEDEVLDGADEADDEGHLGGGGAVGGKAGENGADSESDDGYSADSRAGSGSDQSDEYGHAHSD